YDYKNKYEPGATVETCPAKLSPEITRRVQELSVRAAMALGIEGYCRMDFILRPDGELFCLEINTLPGMTPTSLIPQEAKALGMDYPELCEELIRVSLRKYGVE
ncbi:MAG: D-alanine--D-alanine ligase, partial [Blautia sp.]|nr:D-alanine--D-alanine ligase [Blautia sp.]